MKLIKISQKEMCNSLVKKKKTKIKYHNLSFENEREKSSEICRMSNLSSIYRNKKNQANHPCSDSPLSGNSQRFRISNFSLIG